jgi:hypothetical protein
MDRISFQAVSDPSDKWVRIRLYSYDRGFVRGRPPSYAEIYFARAAAGDEVPPTHGADSH